MSDPIPKEDIAGYECRFAVYCPPPEPGEPDLHVVKEIIHTRSGKTIPNLRYLQDFKRPYWVTKQHHRSHTQKKEWEQEEKLNIYHSTQTNLIRNVAKSLGEPWFRGGLRKLARSPYLYGADILSTAVIKRQYQDKFPQLNTPYGAAAFDIETDVVNGTQAPIIAAIAYKNKVYTTVKRSFVERQVNVIERLQKLLNEHLGDIVKKRGLVWKIEIVDDEVQVVKKSIEKAHQWKPDFLSIWNMDFDIPRVVETLEKNGVNPADVFSDPSVPKAYRHFRYRQGPSQKVTESGKVTPIKPPMRWHTVYTPASFYIIDAMCAYRHIRNQSAEEQSYKLDAILTKEIKRGKLTFPGITTVTEGTLEWHYEMQAKYPLEYIVYNLFDVVGMQELDDTINDLNLTLPMFSGCSDFEHFRSQPRRMVDDLHYYCLENKLVIGTTSDEMITEQDKLTVDTDGWIITLPAHLVMDNGLRIIEHAPWLRSNFRAHTGD